MAVAAGLAVLLSSCATSIDGNSSPTTAAPASSAPSVTAPMGPASPAGSTAVPGSRPAFAPAPLTWTRCGSTECATLSVPVDHGDPGGPQVDLAIARRPARQRDQRLGSLVFNPGGPGASGVDFVQAGATFDDLNDRFDIVSWDPRGVGQSAAVRCGDTAEPYEALDWSPDTAAERTDLDDGARTVAEGCAAHGASLLAHLSTDDTAQDLDRLRQALGDEKLTYVGFSYGTYIGLRYAELFPAQVRAMVLDGVVDPTEDLAASLAGQTRALDQQTTEVFSACDRSSSCPVRDAGVTYDRLAAQVEREPIAAGAKLLGPTELAYAVIGSAYSASASKDLLAGMAAAEQGDGRGLVRLAEGYFGTASYGSYLATLCLDSPHPTGGDAYDGLENRLVQISPRFGAAVANEVRPCAFWSAAPTATPGPVRASGAAPILVVGNRGDFATPYESAVRVADDLDDGVLLTYDGRGHLSYGKSSCIDAKVNDYLTSRTLPAKATACS